MRIGLISDTHMPERWKTLPPAVFTRFEGVDLILHGGDVGELWVLDQLGQIAPVVAVNGNDETTVAVNALPYLQTIATAGHRIVLTHAHYPNRAEELASRGNAWEPHFQRRAGFAHQHGADIIVFGHLHIPMCLFYDGVWLINPGAIASGNAWTRQLVQTVAVMTLEPNGPPQVVHYDLNTNQVHEPVFDASGFDATNRTYSDVILEPDLYAQREWLWNDLRLLAPQTVMEIILGLSHECWSGQRDTYGAPDVVQAFQRAGLPVLLDKLREHPLFRPYL